MNSRVQLTHAKTILDVGQCGFDGPRMTRMLESKVGVHVDTADTLDVAADKLSKNQYSLVLVNRELAKDGAPGLDLIRKMKTAGDATPVMLVSDRPDAQQEALACGAILGFGKSKMEDHHTIGMIKKAIGS